MHGTAAGAANVCLLTNPVVVKSGRDCAARFWGQLCGFQVPSRDRAGCFPSVGCPDPWVPLGLMYVLLHGNVDVFIVWAGMLWTCARTGSIGVFIVRAWMLRHFAALATWT